VAALTFESSTAQVTGATPSAITHTIVSKTTIRSLIAPSFRLYPGFLKWPDTFLAEQGLWASPPENTLRVYHATKTPRIDLAR
jgi:hypothetical protein